MKCPLGLLAAGVALSGMLCTRDGLSFGRTPLPPCISNCDPQPNRPQLAASAGFPDDSNLASCFQRDWNSPGRVRYNGCAGALSWWDVPTPIKSTGTKSFGVFLKSRASGGECWAEVFAANGTLARWNVQTFVNVEQWINFASLAVNSNESAEIQCAVSSISGDYISAVRGF